jgi:hypothetical protein
MMQRDEHALELAKLYRLRAAEAEDAAAHLSGAICQGAYRRFAAHWNELADKMLAIAPAN